MIRSTPNDPTFLFDDLPFHWQMTRCEKYAFASILEAARPAVAIEIGTYKGGSLQLIAEHAEKVYSIDTSSEPQELLGDIKIFAHVLHRTHAAPFSVLKIWLGKSCVRSFYGLLKNSSG